MALCICGILGKGTLRTYLDTVIFLEVPLATLFTDDFGRYPISAMSGNQYIMLAYHDEANVILVCDI